MKNFLIAVVAIIVITCAALAATLTLEAHKDLTLAQGGGPVTITIRQAYETECPPSSEPSLVKNADGSYNRTLNLSALTINCFRTETWQEIWTDLPEAGGKFMQRVTKELY